MLIDEIDIKVSGGHGGAGRVSFYPPKEGVGPDGGNGGKGGDLYIQATSDLYALNKYTAHKEHFAQNGQPGGGNRKSGPDGKDLTIYMPLGTLIINLDTKEEIELNSLDAKTLISKGGLGGRGNFTFKSSKKTTPLYAQPGLPGEEKRLRLILKLIADFGLIGLPNAGKSSLLNELTSAKAKVGDYPFTTLEVNLGYLNGKVIADIPGLIEGASLGKGLGDKFLKHIEKVNLLLHCISADCENPLSDYKTIREEIKKFNPKLLEKMEIILLTKSDLVDERALKKIIKTLQKTKREIIPISIHDFDAIENLKKKLV